MTREQAEKVVQETLLSPRKPGDNRLQQAFYVDMFVALGMLTLEAPRSLESRIDSAARDLGSDPGITSAFLRCIEHAGLKLVDK